MERSSDSNTNYLTGSFRDRTSAERAYNRLRERGYTDEEINIIMSDETRKRYFDKDKDEKETEFGNKAMEGAGKGSAIGGAVGATAGIIAVLVPVWLFRVLVLLLPVLLRPDLLAQAPADLQGVL